MHLSYTGTVQNAFSSYLMMREPADVISLMMGPLPNTYKVLPKADLKDIATTFRETAKGHNLQVVAHATIAMNLASAKQYVRDQAHLILLDEAIVAALLGIKHLVFHPGSSANQDTRQAYITMLKSIAAIQNQIQNPDLLAMEFMPGAGGQMLSTVSEMSIVNKVLHGNIRFCLDTCHLQAAGYDISNDDDYNRLKDEIVKYELHNKIRVFHLNDNVYPAGEHKEKHAPLGQGQIGIDAFYRLDEDPFWDDCLGVIETGSAVDLNLLNTWKVRNGNKEKEGDTNA